MSKPEVLQKSAMNVVEVKAALEAIQKEAGEEEINFRAAKTLEYAEAFAKIKPKQADELKKKLEELDVPRMRDVHIAKLIDVMPISEKHVKMILNSLHLTVSNENVKQIYDAIVESRK